MYLKDLIEAIKDLTSALCKSNWLVDYFIPIFSIFFAAGATLLGSYWLKKREFRSLDSIERKNKIYIPLATIMFKILENTSFKPIPIIIDEESPYIHDPDSLDLREFKKFVERPIMYNIPSDVLSPLFDFETKIDNYMSIFDKVVEKANEIANCYFNKAIEKLQNLNDRKILIEILKSDLEQLKKNKLKLMYSYIDHKGGFLSLIKSISSQDYVILGWSSEDLNLIDETETKGNTLKSRQKFTAVRAVPELVKMDEYIIDELDHHISMSELYLKYNEVCSVKNLASLLEGKILKIKNHHIQ